MSTLRPVMDFESGETSLEIRRVTVHERMSDVFTIDVLARSSDENVDINAIVGKGAALGAIAENGFMAWSGIVNHMEQTKPADESHGQSTYVLRIVPALWLLTQRRNHRIFQHEKTKDIVQKILDEYRIEASWELSEEHPKHEYRVQYGETDFAFVNRLLEEAGIAYYFKGELAGTKGKSKLVISDGPTHGGSIGKINYYEAPNEGQLSGLYMTDVRLIHGVRPGKVTYRDFTKRKPSLDLFDTSSFEFAPGEEIEEKYEQYFYFPNVSRLDASNADEVLPVADDKSTARHDKKENKRRADIAIQAARFGKRTVDFRSNHPKLNAAAVFSIEDHPRDQLSPDTKLMVLESHFFITELDWTVLGTAVFADVPYRPKIQTPKPTVAGIQTAMVVGPPGQEIYTDEYGRVRVRFHWDRVGKFDDNATCWLRVSQAWAGNRFGNTLVPRIGQEVIVQFFEGDPDQPAVIGRLFNQTTQVPRKLPDFKTQSILRTATTPHTAGKFNEIMFEDKAGEELYFVQAERDMLKLVKRNDTERTGEDRTIVVGEGQVRAIAHSDSLQVGKQHLVKMVKVNDLKIPDMGDPDVTPLETFIEMKEPKITLTTGKATLVLDGPNITLEAKGGIRFTVDGQMIIKGSMVFLNVMGGAAPKQADRDVKDAVVKPDRMIGAVEKLIWQPYEATLARKEQLVDLTIKHRAPPPAPPKQKSCAELWNDYEGEAQKILDAAGDDVMKRNKIINGAYADLALEHPEFTWAGEAAYASKQVGCGMEHAAQLADKWYVPSFVPNFAKNMLAKTNRDIFMDAYPAHKFYADHGAKRLRECGSERKEFPLTEATKKAFDDLDKYKETKDPALLKSHSRNMLDHEQRELAQSTAYANKRMRAMLVGSQQGSKVAPKFAPPAELVFEPGCDGKRKTVFQGWDLGNEQQRMEWVNGDMEKTYYNLVNNEPEVHAAQLRQLRQTGVSNGGSY